VALTVEAPVVLSLVVVCFAKQRFFRPARRTERFKEAFRDAVGGTPTAVYEAKLIERGKRTAPAGTSHPSVEPKPRGDDPHVG
jgi:hypothetical protein